MGYFTNPSKLSKDRALSNTWAAMFDDKALNTLETVDGNSIFPLSDISFKELSMGNNSLSVGIGGVLNMSTPNVITRPTSVDITFIDDDEQTINALIREWIKNSPVYKFGRSLHITKSSQYTKVLTLYKLKKDGKFAKGDYKLEFTVFPSEELVQAFTSENDFRTDKLTLRCY